VTELVKAHERLRESAALTYTDYVVRACALSLREHPRLNATLEEAEIRIHPRIDIGLAVDVGDGLIVPVIRGADGLSLSGLAARRADVTVRARAGSLTPDEVSGATFTVSNLGAYGVDVFTPVLNLPEVAILGVGRVARAVIAREDGMTLGYLLSLSLTADHRAVDGAPAARFLQAVGERLGAPEQIVA
jgi:pyruvate dehydrogenase E2 component (dihydrolipoamide acetyltransferase)